MPITPTTAPKPLKMNTNNTESCKRKYTPRANQWTLEDDMKLRQLHGEGKGWTELSAEFGRDPDAIRKHFKYAEEKERLRPVPAAEPQRNIAIDQRSRTQKVRGAWSQGENLKLMQAVHEMGTSWTAIASGEILPGRSVQSITNHYHRDLKNGPGPLCETISNEESVSVYDALQIWNDSPIPFQRDCASRVLSSSELVSKISTESPTIARLVDAMSSADPRALQDALKHNSLELIESRNGCVDLDV